MTHSPTPWRPGKNDGAVVCDDENLGPHNLDGLKHYGGRVVCESAMPRNAEFIVLACNAHSDLLAACKAAVPMLDPNETTAPILRELDEITQTLRTAIKLAEPEGT